MRRRHFLHLSAAFTAAELAALADTPMPTATLGKSGLKVSRLTLGGSHMRRGGEEQGIRIVQRAVELGITMMDSAHKYHRTQSDVTYGKALAGGLRKKVLLMSKAELRDSESAMRQLEETLKNMQTDYLDLWQCHEVATHEEVDKIFGPKGAAEAFAQAKQQGKVRHIGFTGHHDPTVHLRLLEGFAGWETVQMPVNLVDQHYLSFIDQVLPKVRQKKLGVLAMKSNAMGGITRNNIASYEECMQFALSQDIDTLVSGITSIEELEKNVTTVKAIHKLSQAQQKELLSRTRQGPTGVKVENYKKPQAGAAGTMYRDGDNA